MKKILFSLGLLLVGTLGYSQHSSMAYRTLADSLYVHHHYQIAADYYEKALKKSPHPGNIMLQLAKCYHKMNLITASEKWFIKAKRNRGAFSTDDYHQFAQVLVMLKKRSQADSLLEHVLQMDPNAHEARKDLDDLRNFQRYYQDSASIRVQSLLVNTPESEFAPVYYKEGIIFASSKHEGPFKKKSHWDNTPFLNLYYARKTADQSFAAPELFEEELNTRHHDGPAMFYDKFQKMILNRNQRVEVNGRENIFEWHPGLYDAQFDAAKSSWKVTPLPFNVADYSYLHPCISEDGTVLYFASDKPGGYGGTDIYRAIRSDGAWGPPANLGPAVNTADDEAFPFLIDNTLYFTSNGHGGLGGLDIFKCERSGNSFTPPVNLGYPINSTADDLSFVTHADQRDGYFASSRNGNDDLFSFHKLSTATNVLAKGVVKNTLDEFVDGFRATVTNKKTGSVIPVQTDKGAMNFLGERGQDYTISVEHENYQTALQELSIPLRGMDTEKFAVILKDKSKTADTKLLVLDTEQATSKMYLKSGESVTEVTEKDVKALGIQKAGRTNLRNIYFDFDKATLDDEDKVYLQQVKTILEHDPSYKLLIAGHADDRGDENYNIRLSDRRVQVVTNYLVSLGILKERIIQKAYGESLPQIPCYAGDCSEEDHQKNRRAEFVLRYDTVQTPAPPLSKTSAKAESKSRH